MRAFEWDKRDSNPRPPACKAGALNQLSYYPVFQRRKIYGKQLTRCKRDFQKSENYLFGKTTTAV